MMTMTTTIKNNILNPVFSILIIIVFSVFFNLRTAGAEYTAGAISVTANIGEEEKNNSDIIKVGKTLMKADEIIIKFKDNAQFAGLIPELLPNVPSSIKKLNGAEYLKKLELLNSQNKVLNIERIMPQFDPKINKSRIAKLSSNEWIVLDRIQTDKFVKSLRLINKDYIKTSEGYFINGKRIGNLGNAYTIKLRDKQTQVSIKRLCKIYRSIPNVEYVQPNYIYRLSESPDDPEYGRQQVVFSDINAEEAWDICRGSPDVKVAVIDSGIDTDHPDLLEKIMPGWNFRDNNANIEDLEGHGTMVSGIIGAVGNNGIGVAGMDWNCKIIPLKIPIPLTSDRLSFMISVAVVLLEADVINMSVECVMPGDEELGRDNILQQEIDQAYFYGVVCVAGAGNSSFNRLTYPAGIDQVISVAALEGEGHAKRAPYSNFGSQVDVSAPADLCTTAKNGAYGAASGTSMAAPCVSGLAALIIARYGDELGNGQDRVENVTKLIKYTATKINTDRYIGTGRINMGKALTGLPETFAGINFPENNSSLTGIININGTALGRSYELWWNRCGEDERNVIAEGGEVIEGEFGQLNAEDFDEGWYTLHLKTVSDQVAPKVDLYEVQFFIDHGQKDGWPFFISGDFDIKGTPNFAHMIDNDAGQKIIAATDIPTTLVRPKIYIINSSGAADVQSDMSNMINSSGYFSNINDQPVAIGDVIDEYETEISYMYNSNYLVINSGDYMGGLISYDIDMRQIDNEYNQGEWKCNCPPVIADVDDNGTSEIILAVNGKRQNDRNTRPIIYILNGSNKTLLFPLIQINRIDAGEIYVTPCITDLDDNGEKEIVIRTTDYIFVYDLNGRARNGWPKRVSSISGNYCGPVTADIDDNGEKEVITTGIEGDILKIFAWRPNGELVEGWPKEIGGRFCHATGISAGDIDNDKKLEVAIGTSEGKVSVFRHNGLILFRKEHPGEEIKSTILLGDVDYHSEERLVVVNEDMTETDGIKINTPRVNAQITGINVKNAVNKLNSNLLPLNREDPNIGITIDTDKLIPRTGNEIDIIYATSFNKIYAYHPDGRSAYGFPKSIPKESYQTEKNIDLAILDIDGNETLELMASCTKGKGIYVWETGRPYIRSRILWDRRMYSAGNNLDYESQ